MTAKTVICLALGWAMTACSTSRDPSAEPAPPPPPEITLELPLEPPPARMARACQLGTSCLELDERPFEACLVGAKRCADKRLEPIPAQGPATPSADPGATEVRR